MNYTKGAIGDLLDFSTPNVGYETVDKQDICGCCGTYFVVSPGELAHAQEVMKEMYEALKVMPKYKSDIGEYAFDVITKALAKAEGKE